jgi:hypothetical protein
MKNSTAKTTRSSHRVYLRPGGGEFLRCEAVSDEKLADLAESAHQTAFAEAGPNRFPSSEISRLLGPLEALAWPHKGLVTDPQLLRRVLLRKIADNRSRIALRTGKRLLAGVHIKGAGDRENRTLFLVLAGRNVHSCDWQLPA